MPGKSEKEIYQELIDWLRKAWWGLPDSKHLMPTVQAFYNSEEAALLTGIPFSGRSLEELSEMKGMTPEELAPNLDALARRAAVWRSEKGGTIRYSLNDSFFVFMRGPFWAEKRMNPQKIWPDRSTNIFMTALWISSGRPTPRAFEAFQ